MITLVVHAMATGDRSRKKAVATKSFWTLNLVLIAIVGMWWMRSAAVDHDIANEKKRVMDYVRSHDSIVQRFGTSVDVSIGLYTMKAARDPLPQRYEVSFARKDPESRNDNSDSGIAIVSVKESAGQRHFVLDCITCTPIGRRDPFKHPCEQ
jgi:hypothetical protein